jgi:N-acetylglucosaminyldiphosphoundecaprenol N-acetyl-beta-D-mannosaminyltransferase
MASHATRMASQAAAAVSLGEFAGQGAAAEASVRTIALFGLPIANVTMAEAVAHIAQVVESGVTQQIATANLDFARNARKDEYLHRIICDCGMVLPDGAPMLWAARLFSRPLKERVTGVDLIPRLAELSARYGYGIFLLGSQEPNTKAAAEALQKRYPGVNIVGRYSPEVKPLEEMNDDEILARIHAARPRILLVAFGNPKQELWIYRNRAKLKGIVSIGIGGSLDMIAGSLKRAPRFVQWLQLEWFFRLAQEPRRLLPRYASDFKALCRHLPAELLANLRQRRERSIWPLEVSVEDNTRILRMPEVLSGHDCIAVTREASVAVERRQILVFDMVLTGRIEADGLGCLLEARRMMAAARLPSWTTGVAEPVRRVVESAGLVELVRVAATVPEAVHLSTRPAGERRRSTDSFHGLDRRTRWKERREGRANEV